MGLKIPSLRWIDQRYSSREAGGTMNAILRMKDLRPLVCLAQSSVYEQVKVGTFPKPIKMAPRSAGWLRSEIDAWVVVTRRRSAVVGDKLKQMGDARYISSGHLDYVMTLNIQVGDSDGLQLFPRKEKREPKLPFHKCRPKLRLLSFFCALPRIQLDRGRGGREKQAQALPSDSTGLPATLCGS